MAGLVPAIHVLLARYASQDVDARDKPGHDDVVIQRKNGMAAFRKGSWSRQAITLQSSSAQLHET
jgi:hypothetical protein